MGAAKCQDNLSLELSIRHDSFAALPSPVNPHRPALKEARLSPIDALWHLLNFFVPALGVGVVASLCAKLLWRRALKRVSWRRLGGWATACSAVVLVGGLVVFGHDGKMATYGAMVLACAITLWWVGFGPRGR